MMQALEAVQVVLAVEKARQRIPEGSHKTFFGLNDWWQYDKSDSPHMCHQCDFYGDIKFFNGTDIRTTFPELEIIDDDTINPNVHPNCMCLLTRVLNSVS
jgi:hypothetical protein